MTENEVDNFIKLQSEMTIQCSALTNKLLQESMSHSAFQRSLCEHQYSFSAIEQKICPSILTTCTETVVDASHETEQN